MHKETIVIGAGIAGVLIAKSLNATLITKHDEFVFLPTTPDYISNQEVNCSYPVSKCHDDVIIQEVTRVDTNKQEVHTAQETYSYEYLVIATGAQAFAPIPGTDKHAQAFYNKEDAKQLVDTKNQDVVIIGAGPTGIEVAFELARNNSVTLLQRSKIIPMYSRKLQEYTRKQLQKANIALQEDTLVSKVTKKYVHTDKEKLTYDVCISVTGVKANIPKGIVSEKGILVNKYLQVQDAPTVFAAGDCAQSGNPLTAQAAHYEADLVINNIQAHKTNKQMKENDFTSKGMFLLLGDTAAMDAPFGVLTGWPAKTLRKVYYRLQMRKYRK